MARTPNTPTAPTAAPAILERAELAVASEQSALIAADAAVADLARQLNYQGSTDPDVLENSARDAIRRIGAGIFELGGYLLLLKRACEYGQFLPALERLGLAPRAAQQYMNVTRRFANTKSISHLEGTGIAKLVELLPLDDGQLEDLTELGQTGELALDDVARMSVRELRTAVHKARADAAKQQRRAERQEAAAAELHEELRAIKRLPPDEERKRVQQDAADILAEVQAMVRGNLRQALIALAGFEGDQRPHMAGMLGQLGSDLAELRDEFGLHIDPGSGTPEWERWAKSQEAAAH